MTDTLVAETRYLPYGEERWENRQALATAIDDATDTIGDTIGSQFPLDGPSEGWAETTPPESAADPYYIPGPTLSLSGLERYAYFVKKAADWEEIWSLKTEDGWVLAGDDQGVVLLAWTIDHGKPISSCNGST
jgi:hypothetical protein